jgi:hypothetical protein
LRPSHPGCHDGGIFKVQSWTWSLFSCMKWKWTTKLPVPFCKGLLELAMTAIHCCRIENTLSHPGTPFPTFLVGLWCWQRTSLQPYSCCWALTCTGLQKVDFFQAPYPSHSCWCSSAPWSFSFVQQLSVAVGRNHLLDLADFSWR